MIRIPRAVPFTLALAATLALSCLGADAKTLRWAGRGDMQTTDPHSQNENLTNNINQLVYEFLIVRDKKLGLQPALAESWTQVNPTTWRFKLRPGVKFHDGTPFTADDVVFSFERARSETSQLRAYANASRHPEEDRRPDRRIHDQRPQSDRARAHQHDQHHEQGLEREEQGDQAAELLAEGGHDHRAPGEWHGPLHAEDARARREDGARQESELVGHQGRQIRGQRRRGDLHADRLRRDARRRAPLRRSRPRQRPAAAGRAASRADARHQGARRHREPHRVHRHGPGARRAPLFQRQGQESVQGQARTAGALSRDRHRRDPEEHDARTVAAVGRNAALAAHDQRGNREAPPVRPRARQEAAGGSRLPQRLRSDARLPEQPLRQRREDLPGAGGHVGARSA